MIILKAYIGNIVNENHNGAIVNAAKTSLLGGGGVDGAIHQAAGTGLHTECKQIPLLDDPDDNIRCHTGGSVMTGGHDLKVPHIIHTVGPIYKDDSRVAPAKLTSCYRTAMSLAIMHNLPEITFPAIGTGIYGYPLEEATVIAVNTVITFKTVVAYSARKENITVNFICFDAENFLVYKRVIEAAKNHWVVAEVFN